MAENKRLDRLWTPWRMEYILDDNKPGGCIFCDKPKEEKDRENMILFRGENVFVIMNRYPYNNGHLMITPYSHVSTIDSLSMDELSETFAEVQRTVRILKEAMSPEGFNIGINIGKAAGAGIEEHLHVHVVPRWGGDTNFMPVLADVRVMPELLDETYSNLYDFFNRA
jgi:ATP adenylyltransferase